MRRFSPGKNTWALHPARTLIWGVVGPGVARLELRVPGRPPQALPIGRRGRSLLAVLDGRVDPRAAEVHARLHDGRLIVQRGSTPLRNDRGHAVAEPPTQPYRTVAAARSALAPGFAIPIANTVRTGAMQPDPGGGAPWVLRTFLGKPNLDEHWNGHMPGRFSCWEVGRQIGGVLRRATAGRPGDRLTFGEQDAKCNDDGPQPRVPVELTAYTRQADAYSPRVDTLVVHGMAPTARRVELLGLHAGPRALTIVGHGGFLAVVAPHTAGPVLRVRVTRADGRVQTSGPLPTGNGKPTDADARAPDPDGGAPWAVVVGPGPRSCMRMGQLIDGRLGYVDPADGSVRYGGAASSCGTRLRHQAVELGVQPVTSNRVEISEQQIQRRTLSGRTILYGRVREGITSITLRTPRDIRSIRPTGPGRAFIAVYDGALTAGTITVTPHGTNPGQVLRLPSTL